VRSGDSGRSRGGPPYFWLKKNLKREEKPAEQAKLHPHPLSSRSGFATREIGIQETGSGTFSYPSSYPYLTPFTSLIAEIEP